MTVLFDWLSAAAALKSLLPGRAAKALPITPGIPWREKLPDDPGPFDLLDWRSRLVPLIGRDKELGALVEWARAGDGPSARFVTGSGGAGKTRLAAEVATQIVRGEQHWLDRWRWRVGFLKHDFDAAAASLQQTSRPKLLIIVDYSEERREEVVKLLRAMAEVPENAPAVRVIFCTRLDYEKWIKDIDAAGAAAVCREHDLELRSLDEDEAVEVFKQVPEPFGPGAAVREDEVRRWLRRDPSLHHAPLFVVAAALHAARDPEARLTLTAREVVEDLVRRETKRMNGQGKALGFADDAVPRLAALAACRGKLSASVIRRLAKEAAKEASDLGLPEPDKVVDAARRLDGWRDGALRAPQPDVVAAAMLHLTFAERRDRAAEWLWAALRDAPPEWVDTVERLTYDLRRIYSPEEVELPTWLEKMVAGRPERTDELWFLLSRDFGDGVLPLTLAVENALLDNGGFSGEARAVILDAYSAHLWMAGEVAWAVEFSQKSVTIHRELAEVDRARYLPGLAMSLSNQSNWLAYAGEADEALKAIEEAVRLCRPLAREHPARYEPDLASSLINLSNCLSDTDKVREALMAAGEAAEVYRRLAVERPARFKADLAMSLNNMANLLTLAGGAVAAREVITEAVKIYRRLAVESPARYEAGLAMSLTNWAKCFADTDKLDSVRRAIEKAVEIRRRLARANPPRFEPELATSLIVQGFIYERIGEVKQAIACLEEAVTLFKRHESGAPGRVQPNLRNAEEALARLRSAGDSAST